MKEFDHMTPTALELMCNKKWLESRIAEQDRYIDGYLSQVVRRFKNRRPDWQEVLNSAKGLREYYRGLLIKLGERI